MAQKHRASICFLAFVIFNLICFAFSRSLESSELEEHYQELDVKASIAKTQALFTLTPQTFQQQETQTQTLTPSSILSLTLHPLSAFRTPEDQDYAAVTKTRLARDAIRVNSLTTRLQLGIHNFNNSEFKPVQTSFGSEDIQAPITSGASQGSGEYFTRIGVGQPVKQFYLVIDTGSDISWLQCEPCMDCYHQSDPYFNPSSSRTYKQVACNSNECNSLHVSTCVANTCQYQVSYGDGSYTVGDLATDTVSFGSSNTIPNIALGCGHDNEGLFVGAAGLLGLGHGALSFPSQIKATSFSYCLVDRDSTSSSTLEFNSARPSDSIVAPLVHNSRMDTFFYVGLTGLSVGGSPISLPKSVFAMDASGEGGIIVDSGTAVTRLQTEAYNSLRDAFVTLSQHLPKSTSFALFDTCYDLSSMTTASVPTVAFNFAGGKSLRLHAKNYLIPVDSSGKFCFAFAPTSGSLSIIGNIQQQGTRVSYDLANNLVGFSPDKC
ncbi:aspartic protease [Lithospermum erythrorhizon]|uniref:Aspartic protease n=1 Tax=Lithospermum erythrorhizon TaxID=34254 RepID=A0AAV3QMU6_LITER